MNTIDVLKDYADFALHDAYTDVVDAYTVMDDIIDRLNNEYMELPRDCTGRTIHVGDTVLDEDELLEIAGIVDSDYVIVLTEYGYARTLYRKRLALVPPDDGDGAAAIDE